MFARCHRLCKIIIIKQLRQYFVILLGAMFVAQFNKICLCITTNVPTFYLSYCLLYTLQSDRVVIFEGSNLPVKF